MVFEVFGRRLVSRVLISQVLLLASGGVYVYQLYPTHSSRFSLHVLFLSLLHESRSGHACATDGGLMVD